MSPLVSFPNIFDQVRLASVVDKCIVDEPDEDNMEEIDLDNIIPDGRRTRGRQIDFAKAAEELPEDDEDEDEDDDFEGADDDDKMEE